MSEYQISAALLRTLPRLMSRSNPERDRAFEDGLGTKPATQAYKQQAASLATQRLVRQTARQRYTPEERKKEIVRRRNWAGGGGLPPGVRASYSEAERAVLAVIGDRCRRKGFCDLCIDEIARIAGVGRTSVQNTIRKARSKERSHISVRERPQERGKHLTHVIKVICSSWLGWITRAIGFKRLNTSETAVKNSLTQQEERLKKALEKERAGNAGEPINRRDGWSPAVEEYSNRWRAGLQPTHGSRRQANG